MFTHFHIEEFGLLIFTNHNENLITILNNNQILENYSTLLNNNCSVWNNQINFQRVRYVLQKLPLYISLLMASKNNLTFRISLRYDLNSMLVPNF